MFSINSLRTLFLALRNSSSTCREARLSTLPHSSVLLRDYIQDSLYHPVEGYFARNNTPVGKLDGPIDYKKIVNETEYKLALKRRYEALQVAWLTPVELFQPHYGNAIAKYVLETFKHALHTNTDLHIYEIGGGTGTLARNVLDYIAAKAPALYPTTRYTCIEISARLASLQQQHVATQGGHERQFQVQQRNAWDAEAWGPPQEAHCFVLMTEVLDNLPHDRVERSKAGGQWQQTVVEARQAEARGCGGGWVQGLKPVEDELVQRCLQAGYGRPEGSDEGEGCNASSGSSSSSGSSGSSSRSGDSSSGRSQAERGEGFEENGSSSSGASHRGLSWLQRAVQALTDPGASQDHIRYLPTAYLALMDLLHTTRPHHTLIAADFNKLPDVRIPGTCAPLVSSLERGRHTDHDTIYVPRGSADIFFPSDFEGLCRLYRQAAALAGTSSGTERSVHAAHVSTASFMQQFADYAAVNTLTGYNPMLQDYSNTSFLLASSFHQQVAPAKKQGPTGKKRGTRKKSGGIAAIGRGL